MFLGSGAKGLPAQCGYVRSIGPVEILAAPACCTLSDFSRAIERQSTLWLATRPRDVGHAPASACRPQGHLCKDRSHTRGGCSSRAPPHRGAHTAVPPA
jgi:hypothetical protein